MTTSAMASSSAEPVSYLAHKDTDDDDIADDDYNYLAHKDHTENTAMVKQPNCDIKIMMKKHVTLPVGQHT